MTDFSSWKHRSLWGLTGVAVLLGGVVLYLALAGGDSDETSTAAAGPTGGNGTTVDGAQLMVRAVNPDDPDGNGRVFVLKEGRPQELSEGLDCERVYYAGGRGLCLVTTEGGDSEHAIVFDSSLRALKRLPLDGLPSRTRVSRDGRYGAMTAFVNGHGYEGAGGFSTATTLVDMGTESVLGNLESFAVTKDGKSFEPDRIQFLGRDLRQRLGSLLRDHADRRPSLPRRGLRARPNHEGPAGRR